jgi:hypothetical protein
MQAFDLRVVLRDGAEAFEEEPVRELHDVRLVDGRHLSAPLPARVLEGELRDARRGLRRDDLDALDDARHDDVLDARIQVLRVLTHDHEIEFRIPRRHVRQRPHGPQVRVEIERLAQADVDGGEALADGRRDRAFERDLVALDRFEEVGGQRVAELFQRLRARVVRLPLDLDARRLDDPHHGGGDFRPDPVARNECDSMFHKKLSAVSHEQSAMPQLEFRPNADCRVLSAFFAS